MVNFTNNLINDFAATFLPLGTLEKLLAENKVPPGNDQSKYFWEYQNGVYKFSKNLQCKVLAIVKDNSVVDQAIEGDECILVTDHTHLYHEAGGQASDTGTFDTPNCHLEVLNVQREGNFFLIKEFS
jgi:alanyl-tRNA synthetase